MVAAGAVAAAGRVEIHDHILPARQNGYLLLHNDTPVNSIGTVGGINPSSQRLNHHC